MAEPMLLAAKKAWLKNPDLKFITSHVNEQRYREFYEYYQSIAPELPLTFFTRRSHDTMAAADVVIVTSGTATLETMLFKKPMIITYRMGRLTKWLAKYLVKTPFAGLPNLLAGRMLVPELIQEAAHPDAICEHLLDYLEHPDKVRELERQFIELHQSLRTDAADDIAEAILSCAIKK